MSLCLNGRHTFGTPFLWVWCWRSPPSESVYGVFMSFPSEFPKSSSLSVPRHIGWSDEFHLRTTDWRQRSSPEKGQVETRGVTWRGITWHPRFCILKVASSSHSSHSSPFPFTLFFNMKFALTSNLLHSALSPHKFKMRRVVQHVRRLGVRPRGFRGA